MRDVRVAIVCPSFMHFTRAHATSVDLFVHECVSFSRYRESTLVLGREIEEPFEGTRYAVNTAPPDHDRRFALGFVDALRAFKPDVIDVQQHAPTAGVIALSIPDTPVFLTRHNSIEPPVSLLRRPLVRTRYQLLDGLLFCSGWLRDNFCQYYPELRDFSRIVHNGIDVRRWGVRQLPKEKVVICVGRMMPAKGLLEFADACRELLPRHPGWRARIVAGSSRPDPAYAARVEASVAASNGLVELMPAMPHDAVMQAYETAEIAVVPSIWEEPLGRTAIEAHCAGTALVSSGSGGLREVSADEAVYVPEVDARSIAAAIGRLVEDPDLRRRLQQSGRKRIEEEFDIRRVAAHLDDLRMNASRRAGTARRVARRLGSLLAGATRTAVSA